MTQKAKTSKEIREEYNNVCFLIGLEARNSKRALEAISRLEKQQKELEESFNSTLSKENEFAKLQAEADAKTKAFEAKAAEASQQTA